MSCYGYPLGRFLKRVKPTTSQDGACLMAIKENLGRITSLPQRREEGSAGGSSSGDIYCTSDTSHSTKGSKVRFYTYCR